MTVMTRQRMPAAERREMVLEAAVAEFAARGLAGTSTEDVARPAGISQPYLFRLFPTKKALFLAPVDRCFRQGGAPVRGGGRRPGGRGRTRGDGRRLRPAPPGPHPAAAPVAGLRGVRRPGD